MQKIAVIGSGIGGLAACWFLGKQHDVVLYEKHPQLGMAAHGLEWGGARVDMPLRVIYRGYYPSLSALYTDAEIDVVSADYSASFSDLGGSAYFRYRNWRPLPRVSLPYPAGQRLWARRSRRILADLARLYQGAHRDMRKLRGSGLSLGDWLAQKGFSDEFCEDFLLPTFAAINTCRIDSVRDYPAELIVDYLRRGVLLEGVSRTVKGADFVVERLSSRCLELRLGTGIVSMDRSGDGVLLRDAKGGEDHFDHVVLATQGNQALRLLADEAEPEEQQVLSAFQYEPSEVIVHTDEKLMPGRRKDWSPVNFFTSVGGDRPMASIWLNRVLSMRDDAPDAFQTWNPLCDIDPDKVAARARFERPVVNAESQRALEAMRQLHQQAGRNVWFCGSYAESGVPLLESATRSAKAVAAYLNAMD